MSPFNSRPDAKSNRRKILFFAEAVTLAHVARPLVLAQSLDPALYEVCFVCDSRYDKLLNDLPFERRSISSIASERFLAALAKGSPVYDLPTLRSYVQDDLQIIREFKPDLIVGDFRLSLSVSARLAKAPYIAITNAYWSPYARQRFPLPDLPMIRFLGLPLSKVVFKLARPIAFALHTVPMNRLRKENGLGSLGWDLRQVYTDADRTLYADVPDLVNTFERPDSHVYLGPIIWSPPIGFPPWWNDLVTDKPIIYVTLGSSGNGDLLPHVLKAMATLQVTVVVATAGRAHLDGAPENCFAAEYLPGAEVAARANLVICNGGSPTTHQALAAGTPVIGICNNMDQYLNMQSICRAHAGETLRASFVKEATISYTAQKILGDKTYAEAASNIAKIFATYGPAEKFKSVIDSILLPVLSSPKSDFLAT